MTLRTNLCLLSLTVGCAFFSSSTLFDTFSSSCLKRFLRGHGWVCGGVFFFFPFLFFLSYQRNALRAQWYSCPHPLFCFHTIFPVTAWAPLTMGLLDTMTDETAKSESLALGFGRWVVSCRRLPCQRHCNASKKAPFLIWASSWHLCPSHGNANPSATVFNEVLIRNDGISPSNFPQNIIWVNQGDLFTDQGFFFRWNVHHWIVQIVFAECYSADLGTEAFVFDLNR